MAEITPRASESQAGSYVYCVAPSNEEVCLGPIGIEGLEVYTVVQRDLCALVHAGPSQPYQSDDSAVGATWITAHHQVVETAWSRWSVVLPMNFNTIVISDEETTAEQRLKSWLDAEYHSLKNRLDGLTGKAEYGLQVYWDPVLVAKKLAQANAEITELQRLVNDKPRGLAYMYRQKLEALLKTEMEARAAEEFKTVFARVRKYVDNVHVDRTKKIEEGRQMLVNLSCLVSDDQHPGLEAELEQIGGAEGFSVRLAGPFPPYSFC